MTTELPPSKLGTKEHWDKVYAEELSNFKENNDEGEIWFGEESIEKMVNWSLEHVPPSLNPTVLEVGSGNGTLLFALAEANYPQTRLLGIDYSEDAVELARNISATRNTVQITFRACNFLNDDPPPLPGTNVENAPASWDLVLDKGTYDAIALGQKDENGGIFLITSCNFTEEELKSNFATEETGLIHHSHIQHPKFTFGGRSGSIISSMAFRKPT